MTENVTSNAAAAEAAPPVPAPPAAAPPATAPPATAPSAAAVPVDPSDAYWKRPPPQEGRVGIDPGIGLWSRSRAFRLVAWFVSLAVVVFLALAASAYFSGFGSVPEMLDWLVKSLVAL